jgi:dihydroorotase
MKVLIKQAKILDPGSVHDQTLRDILVVDGKIQEINTTVSAEYDQLIEADNLHVSPGFTDVFSNFADPGFEYKETLESGAAAAAGGGFTRVMVIPNTKPAIDVKAQVEYVVRKSHDLPVRIIPIGAVTKNNEGKELAEMYDMQQSGAVAFSDGTRPIQTSGMMLKALQYVKKFNGVVIQVPDDESMAPHGLVNEGITSTRMGLPGKPVISEELMVHRDIALAGYTNSNLHLTGVSSPRAIDAIHEAKQKGISVTCSVTPYHLFFCEEDLHSYDTYLKVNPPLRSRADMMALRQAVLDGKVDAVASHHFPHEFDSKILEFEYARNGMISLQTAFSAVRTAIPGISEEQLVSLFAISPAKIFGLETELIETGSNANLTLFVPDAAFRFEQSINRSKSKNSPFTGKDLKGKIIGTLYNNSIRLN